MPEMPEVETMVRDLTPRLVGRTIESVSAAFEGIVRWPDFDEFRERVEAHRIASIGRRGKYAIFSLDSGDLLVIHRGMTGTLLLRPADHPLEPYVRIVFHLENRHELRFQDPRKFGQVLVMDEKGEERPLPWARMGPEPLGGDFSLRIFRSALRGRTGLLKPLLLGQRIVAGLGNIYVDEALYRSRIHPQRAAGSLRPAEIGRLHVAIRAVLTEAIERRGTTFNGYADIEGRAGGFQESLQIFRRDGEPCPRCRTVMLKLTVGGRGTHICPHCQKA